MTELEILLEELCSNFMLIHRYPYLDEDRSQAIAMEKRLKDLLKSTRHDAG
jgi:hypothetical protein